MAINFPTSPSINDEYSYENRTWIWTGSAWRVKPSTVSPFVSVADSFTGDGTTTDFTLSAQPNNTDYTIIVVAGVVQPRNYYSITNDTLSFTTAPPSGAPIEITILGGSSQPPISSADVANTVAYSNQANITSVGTLTSLAVSGTVSLGTVGNVHITGGTSGQILKTDGAGNLSWQSPTAGSAATLTYTPAFKGALLYTTVGTSLPAGTWTKITFDSISYDTTGGSLTGTANRFTIPAGVTKVKLSGSLVGLSQTDQMLAMIYKNGTGLKYSTDMDIDSSGQDSPGVFTAVVPVTQNDYFELWGFSQLARSTDISVTWLNIEIVEGTILNTVISSTLQLSTLTDVDVGTNPPTSGQMLSWNSGSNVWVPTSTASFTSLSLAGLLTEGFVTKTGATGTVAHDVTSGGTFYHTSPAANFTANFTNVPTTASKIIVVTLVIAQGSTPYVPSTFQIDGTTTTVSWLGGSAPSGTASKYDVISYSLFRVGSSWTVFGSTSTFG